MVISNFAAKINIFSETIILFSGKSFRWLLFGGIMTEKCQSNSLLSGHHNSGLGVWTDQTGSLDGLFS
jgi:hypothetical protein